MVVVPQPSFWLVLVRTALVCRLSSCFPVAPSHGCMATWEELERQLLRSWEALADDMIQEADDPNDDGDAAAPLQAGRGAEAMVSEQFLRRPMLSEEHHQSLLLRTPCPATRPALARVCDEVMQWIEAGGGMKTLDPFIQKLCHFFVESKHTLHTSKEVIGRFLHEPPIKIEEGLSTLAASLYHTDRQQHHEFEAAIADTNAIKLLYMEVLRYDETPMRLTEKELTTRIPTSASATSHQRPPPAAATSSTDTPASRGLGLGKATTVSKLFATEARYGMLLKLPERDTDDDDFPNLVFFTGSCATHLQVLGAATGEVMKEALDVNAVSAPAAEGFIRKVRFVTVDQAGSNAVAERRIMSSRPGWEHVQFPCCVHILAACHSKSFALAEELIQGMIHFSLSLRTGTLMSKFRRSLLTILDTADNYDFIPGDPPVEHTHYKEFMVKLFAGTGGQKAVRRDLLLRYPNGNWRRTDKIEVYLPQAQQKTQAEVHKDVKEALLMSLGSRAFRVYPRHRWLGADICMDQLGIILAGPRTRRAGVSPYAGIGEREHERAHNCHCHSSPGFRGRAQPGWRAGVCIPAATASHRPGVPPPRRRRRRSFHRQAPTCSGARHASWGRR